MIFSLCDLIDKCPGIIVPNFIFRCHSGKKETIEVLLKLRPKIINTPYVPFYRPYFSDVFEKFFPYRVHPLCFHNSKMKGKKGT